MRLTDAAVPSCLLEGGSGDELVRVDVVLEGERIASVTPSGQNGAVEGEARDCAGGILVPAFVDMHTHLDKGHIVPRQPNPDGTFDSALASVKVDRLAHWSAEDVRRRMEFSLRCAYAHGTAAIRTHIDCLPPSEETSMPVFAEVREAWRDKITLQASSLQALDDVPSGDEMGPWFDKIIGYGGMVGAVLNPTRAIETHLPDFLRHAEERGQDVDFHVDETLDPTTNSLETLAILARDMGFSGTITCGHCCSLMTMDEGDADRTLDACAEAGLAFVSLPMCNLYLQDRSVGGGRTPRVRGGTLVHEMVARGLRVAIASDNTRDPFYAYGDLDMLEVWREGTRILQLDHPRGDWARAFSVTPAAIMGLPDRDSLGPGAPADLVLFNARRYTELLSRPQSDRTVIRKGKVIDAAPPDYRELDALWT